MFERFRFFAVLYAKTTAVAVYKLEANQHEQIYLILNAECFYEDQNVFLWVYTPRKKMKLTSNIESF